MKNSIKVGLDQKQRDIHNLNAKTQRLFGFVKNIFAITENSEQAFNLPEYEVNRMSKEYAIEAEQKKANAVMFVQRRQLHVQ